jgi:hypothetical protein
LCCISGMKIITNMRRRELSLLGALVFCAVAIAIHKLLNLDESKDKSLS